MQLTDNSDIIQIRDLNKWYGEFHVLKDINLSVRTGEKIVICGPSGSGKSTLIRCINALENYQSGSLTVLGNGAGGQQGTYGPCVKTSAWYSSSSTCSPT